MGYTKMQRIVSRFAQMVLERHVVVVLDNEWCMNIHDKECRLHIPRVIEWDEGDAAFRENFYARCPFADTFSDITITILHELGHWIIREHTLANLDAYIQACENITDVEEYFTIPDEYMATEWAINWLMSEENRTIAHDFDDLWPC